MTDTAAKTASSVALSPRPRWAVVGGGLLGMTIALRLAQSNADVTLDFEE